MRIRVLLIVLSLFCTTWAVAQNDDTKTDTEKKASESKAKQGDESKDTVYTKEHLREQVDESAKSPSVIYNENLERKSAAGGDTSTIVFTNQTLTQRYGDPEPAPEPRAAAGTTQPSPGTAPAGDAAADPNAEPGAEPDAEPAMSPEERTQRIPEIEAEIGRLEKRTLAIKNPFLARTAPPTNEERTKEQGMNNPERLQSVESQMAKLKAKLQELQSGK